VRRNDEGDPVVRGRHGVISQYKDGDLDVWVTNLRVALRVERGGWKAKNHYDDGAVFVRPFGDLDRAARYIQANKRRTLSPEGRLAMIERLKGWAFRKGHLPIKASRRTESPKTVQEPVSQTLS